MSSQEIITSALGDPSDQLTWTHVMIGFAAGAVLGLILRFFGRKK